MTVPPREPFPYGQPGPGPAQPPYGSPQSPPYDTQPQYGAQQYGAQQFPHPPYATPPRRTNPFAIASLVFGVIGGSLLSIIFGIVALKQIKERGEQGRGLALAGFVLSVCWILLIGVGVTVAIVAASQEEKTNVSADQRPGAGSDTGTDVGTGDGSDTKRVNELEVGDCLKRLSEGTHFLVSVVPCSAPHRAEVFAKVTLTGISYPGESVIAEEAENRCSQRLTSIADPEKLEDLNLFYFGPTRSSWEDGDRQVLCLVMDPNRDRTGRILEGGPAA